MQGLSCHQYWEMHSFTLCPCQLTVSVSYSVEAPCRLAGIFFFQCEYASASFFVCFGQVFHPHKMCLEYFTYIL